MAVVMPYALHLYWVQHRIKYATFIVHLFKIMRYQNCGCKTNHVNRSEWVIWYVLALIICERNDNDIICIHYKKMHTYIQTYIHTYIHAYVTWYASIMMHLSNASSLWPFSRTKLNEGHSERSWIFYANHSWY